MKKLMLLMAAVSGSLASCVYAMEAPQPGVRHSRAAVSTGIVGEYETAVSKNWGVWYMNKEVQLMPFEFPTFEPVQVKITDFTPCASLLVDEVKYDLTRVYSRNKILQTWLHGKDVKILGDIVANLYYPANATPAIGVAYVRNGVTDAAVEQRIRVLVPGVRFIAPRNQVPSQQNEVVNVVNNVNRWVFNNALAAWPFRHFGREVAQIIIDDDIGQFQNWASQSGALVTRMKPLIRLAALAGSIKVFKLLSMESDQWMEDEYLDKFALFGGNYEIIRLCETIGMFAPEKCVRLFPVVAHMVEPQMVDYLVKRMDGCGVDAKTQALKEGLAVAARHANAVNMIYLLPKAKELIVGNGENRNKVEEWNGIINSMFIQAVELDYIDAVKYLYEVHNADVEVRNADGMTMLQVAAQCDYLPIVRCLCEICHANVETRDNGGMTPLHWAVQRGHLDIVKYLYEACHTNVGLQNNDGRTPLHLATEFGRLDIIKYLYETCHADVEVKDGGNRTPLFYAVRKGHTDIVRYLCETCRADVGATNEDGSAALEIAVRNRNLDIVKCLDKSYSVDLEAKVIWIQPSLEYAIDNGDLDMVKYFVGKYAIDVNKFKNSRGQTMINAAAEKGYLDIVKYLHEECHASVETKDSWGWTPLFFAVENNRLNVMRYLCETCHADIDAKDSRGYTLRRLALEGNNYLVVRYLNDLNLAQYLNGVRQGTDNSKE